MKNKLFLFMYLCLTAFTTNLYAQDTTQETSTNDTTTARIYTFAGIEIKGNYNDFLAEMQKKDYQLIFSDTNRHAAKFYGKMGNTDVYLDVYWTPLTHSVFQVIILYPEHSRWSSQVAEYNKIVNIVDKKYGIGHCVEEWLPPYSSSKHEGEEMDALKKGKLNKFCKWDGIRLGMLNDAHNMLIYFNPSLYILNQQEEQSVEEEKY